MPVAAGGAASVASWRLVLEGAAASGDGEVCEAGTGAVLTVAGAAILGAAWRRSRRLVVAMGGGDGKGRVAPAAGFWWRATPFVAAPRRLLFTVLLTSTSQAGQSGRPMPPPQPDDAASSVGGVEDGWSWGRPAAGDAMAVAGGCWRWRRVVPGRRSSRPCRRRFGGDRPLLGRAAPLAASARGGWLLAMARGWAPAAGCSGTRLLPLAARSRLASALAPGGGRWAGRGGACRWRWRLPAAGGGGGGGMALAVCLLDGRQMLAWAGGMALATGCAVGWPRALAGGGLARPRFFTAIGCCRWQRAAGSVGVEAAFVVGSGSGRVLALPRGGCAWPRW